MQALDHPPTPHLYVVPAGDELPATASPRMTVLQPYGRLDSTTAAALRTDLEQALQQADMVIVDFLWVDRIDDQGIALLLASMERAKTLRKTLTFRGMSHATRRLLDATWERQRALTAPQTQSFLSDFERFLESHHQR